jgi:hypothetical protein
MMGYFDMDPDRKPSDQVKIKTLEITAYPDRRRVFIHIVVTPFEKRPNLLMTARDENDRIVAEMSIIETMHHDMEFTMHLRGVDEPEGLYTLTATLYFETKNPPQDELVEAFEIPAEDAEQTE